MPARPLGVALLVSMLALCNVLPLTARAQTVPIYTDALASGWENWSWSTFVQFANASPVHTGTASLAVNYTGAWAGLYLHASSAITSVSNVTLRFWVHGGSSGGQGVRVVIYDADGDQFGSYAVTPQGGQWTQVDIAMSEMDGVASISGLVWQDTTGGAQPAFYLDDIQLVTTVPPPTPTPTPAPGPTLTVDTTAERHTISEDIYGMNFADETLASELRLPVRRWGGNSTTRYNWQNDTSNRASDWYFENIPEPNTNPAALPNGSATDLFVEQDRRTGTRSLITVPLIGYTPKSRGYDCGYSVAKYGAQQDADPWRPDCGNGVDTDGDEITGNDPLDTSIVIGPDFVTAWINHFIGRYGTAASGGVAYYDLDNEPMLWNSTHRDVRPQPTSYDEMKEKTIPIAAAIKATDPSAATLGPVLWGWVAYFYSALDVAAGGAWWDTRPDRRAHGDVEFTAWYLNEMRLASEAAGVRLLDYLDLHCYPQAEGVFSASAGSADTQALRLRSTRALWDPTYTDESWIAAAVMLIPRMKAWVTANYPGTKLAVTEYSWGAMGHLNGALAQADVLGIFAREGLDLATLWGPPTTSQPAAFAFRIYRNPDGSGRGFGETYVQSTSTDGERLSIFAAERAVDDTLTVVVINKTTGALASPLTITGFSAGPSSRVLRYDADSPAAIVELAALDLSAGNAEITFPAQSITLLMVPRGGPTATLAVSKGGTGSGTVTSDPPGIDCGATCAYGFAVGMPVELTAAADAGSMFAGWGEACSGSGACTVTMDGAKSVTATFESCTVVISGQTFSVTETIESCGTLALGPSVLVTATGNLTAHAATVVTLRNGFEVAAGGRFSVGIDPDLAPP